VNFVHMSLTSALPVFTFHALDSEKSPISFPPHIFRQGLARLHATRHQAVSLDQAVEHVKTGKAFSPRAYVMTFDDGYRSVYDEAFPLICDLHLAATIFLSVDQEGEATERLPSLNGQAMLSWDEIREMVRYGITFGAHTLTHPDLRTLVSSRVEKEIVGSKDILEQALGCRVSSFAYPFGRYDATSHAVARAHFACACSDRLGLISHRSDPYALERIDMYYLRYARIFELVQTGLFPWYILSRRIPREIKRAVLDRRPR
jgi:peptidoglycan/xylan/chitin deacetylase (PgdA/CDA1 family)